MRRTDRADRRDRKAASRWAALEPLDEFIAEVHALDPDAVPSQIDRLNDEIGRLDRELKDDLGPRIGTEQTLLEQMDRGAQAADAAEDVQDLLAKIAADADEYARLRLTLVALRKGIDRYRERHQGPILQRASRHFSQLTLDAFVGLREDYDSAGKPELVGVRAADGQLVRVGGMSDGTADQLYLAVRLAWLEEYLDSHESFPFIVNDILIRFDDQRSAATLQLLADLSRRTQVIFFTHHRHILDLARQILNGGTMFVHELAPRSVGFSPRESPAGV